MTDNPNTPGDSAKRIRQIEETLLQCISGQLDARTPISTNADEIDAIAEGINILVDEFEIILAERDRTQEIEEARRRLANAQRIAHLGSWEWIVPSNTLVWSDETYRIFGLEPQSEPATYDWYIEKVHPDDQETLQNAIRGALEDGTPFFMHQRIIRPDGEVRTLECHASLIGGDAEGTPPILSGTCLDITERFLAEQGLQDRDEKAGHFDEVLRTLSTQGVDHETDLQQALNAITEATANALQVERCSIWLYSQDRNSIRCVDLCTRSVGEHTEGTELFYKDFPAYFDALRTERTIAANNAHTAPQTCEFSEVYLAPLGIASMLDSPIRMGGQMVGVLCNEHTGTARHWTSDEMAFSGSIGDFIAQTMQTKERKDLETQLEHVERLRALGTLAGGVAHDFNNQLAGIRMAAQVLDSNTIERTPVQTQCIQTILKATNHAAELTDQLLAFARGGRYTEEPVDLHDVLDDVVTLLEHTIDPRIKITKNYQEAAAVTVGDPAQLQSMLLNIAINARDAMAKGGTLRIKTEQTTSDGESIPARQIQMQAGNYIRIVIEDTGCGMTEETVQRCFEPFFTTKAPGKGMGMGLSAVYGVVEHHQGGLNVASQENAGTSVEVYLPTSTSLPSPVSRTEPVPRQGITLNVLLLEDESAVAEMNKLILEEEGHSVTLCMDGQQGLERFLASPNDYDAVVLDIIMPGLGGAEVLAGIHEVRPDTPVLLCSGYAPDAALRTLIDTKQVEFLKKPYDANDLLAQLNVLLEAQSTQ